MVYYSQEHIEAALRQVGCQDLPAFFAMLDQLTAQAQGQTQYYKMKIGKYKGIALDEILKMDRQYLEWYANRDYFNENPDGPFIKQLRQLLFQ